jgi:DNA polymerase-3 subunit alpha
MIGRHFPKAEEIDFTDQAVFDDMVNNQLTIFQFESDYAADCFKKMNCHSIDDITLTNAALRPGGASYRDRLFRHEINDNGSEIINNLLKDSYCFLVYQEQVTAFLQYICGFSGSDADSIRRAIGKKDLAKIEAAMPKILEGYCAKSDKPREIAEAEAKKFLKVIEDASSYMFNYNHALGYSLLTYLCGYYRHYYPVEYCTSFLTCAKNQDDFNNGRALAQSLGINIVDIKFRESTWDYRCDPQQHTIYKGLFGVKYMNKTAAENLYTMRVELFDDFVDLIARATEHKVNLRQIEILAKLNFFSEFGSIKYLMKILDAYKENKNRKAKIELTRTAIKDITPEPANDIEAAEYEFEATNTLSRVFPNLEKSCYFIIDKQGRTGQLYQLKTGKIFKIKFAKKNLFDIGMIVKIYSVKQDRKWYKDENNKWKQRDDQYEQIISEFSILNMETQDVI